MVCIQTKRRLQLQNFVEAAYSAGAWPELASDRPRMDIFHECIWRNRTWNPQKSPLPSYHRGKKLRGLAGSRGETNRKGRTTGCSVIKVFQSVEGEFAATIDYQNYLLMKKRSRYDFCVAHWLRKMTTETEILVNDRTLSGKTPMSVINFSRNLKLAWVVCKIQKSIAM